MLTELFIKNLAVIKETRILLKPGLTIVSGEEGAGKSLLVDALCLLVGGRASTALIRNGARAAYVEGTFWTSPEDEAVADLLEEAGIEIEADGNLIVSREVHEQGRTASRVNGKAVPLSLLRRLGQRLIDIHSQMEHLSLLSPQRQLDILDSYAGLLDDRSHLAATVAALKAKSRDLDALTGEDARDRRDLLEYQVGEIERAGIQPGEDERLVQEREILQQAESLKEHCFAAHAALYEDDVSASSLAHLATGAVRAMTSVDPSLRPYLDTLESARADLEHVAQELRCYLDRMDSDPQHLQEVADRLELLRHLKSKYGPGLEDILEFAERCRQELEASDASEERRTRLQDERLALEEDVAAQALKLSAVRREASCNLAAAANDELAHLGMSWAKFGITVRSEERVDGLPAFDTETAAEYYREYLDALAADSRSGRERVFAAVGRIAGDDGAAPLVIQVCLTIAIADRSVGQSEYEAICELSNRLGLDLRDLEV